MAAVAAAPASAEVVFNTMTSGAPTPFVVNLSHDRGETSSTDEEPGGFEHESQSGQHITLAGTSRFVTQIDMRLGGYGGQPTTVSMAMTLRIYGISSGLPGALLWEGTTDLQTFTVSFAPTVHPVSFFPNVQLPDDVILAVSHTQISGQQLSVVGTIGQGVPGDIGVDSDWFSQDATSGIWTVVPGPTAPDHFQTRITAIPAPASGMLGMGLLGVGLRRRRA
jgi:hypothetical protein